MLYSPEALEASLAEDLAKPVGVGMGVVSSKSPDAVTVLEGGRSQSRAEQSRAEQRREEKSRAEQRREEKRREEKRREEKRREEKRREEKRREEKSRVAKNLSNARRRGGNGGVGGHARRCAPPRAPPLPSGNNTHTTCFPSNQSALAQVIKNWHPFVLGPLLARLKSPGSVCLSVKLSSSNLEP